jgi:hypothetical protein
MWRLLQEVSRLNPEADNLHLEKEVRNKKSFIYLPFDSLAHGKYFFLINQFKVTLIRKLLTVYK